MRRAIAVAAGLVSLVCLSFVAVPGASAFPLTTCTLTVESSDASGTVISTATGDGPGGTRDDPLIVDPNGTVTWTGSTGGSVKDGTYHVEIFGVPTPLQGPINSSGSTASGSVDLGDILPFDLVGVVYVSGALDVGGSPYCEGSGWISLRGDPVGTPGFVGGAGLALVGIATVLTSVRGRHPFRGAVGGLLGGAGLALLSGVTGVLPIDEKTPIAEVVAMLILGLAIGLIDFGSLFHRTPVTLVAQAGAAAGTPPDTAPVQSPAGESSTTATEPATGPATKATEPTTATPPATPVAPAPVVVPPAVAPPQVVEPPVVAQQPVVGPAGPGARPVTVTGPGHGNDVAGAPARARGHPGRGQSNLPPEVKPDVEPLFQEAEGILKTGPGTLTIGSDVISKVLAQMEDAPSLTLGNGAIEVLGGAVKATPVVADGKVSLSFSKPLAEMITSPTEVIDGFVGLMADAASATSVGPFDGLNRFIDHINKAVSDAGQRITSVSVTPTGVTVTTGPAIPPTAG